MNKFRKYFLVKKKEQHAQILRGIFSDKFYCCGTKKASLVAANRIYIRLKAIYPSIPVYYNQSDYSNRGIPVTPRVHITRTK